MAVGPKPFVFVLLPFDATFDDVYQLGIKTACEIVDTYCERVDEQQYEGRVLDRIYNQIAKADIIVADMTGKRANVFYETGYAHALRKKHVVLLTQDANDIPFDLKDYPHIVYPSITSLKTQLETKIRWCVANPEKQLATVDTLLEAWVKGEKLRDTAMTTSVVASGSRFALSIDVHNPANVPHEKFSVGLITPNSIVSIGHHETSSLPEDRTVHLSHSLTLLHPDCWVPFRFELATNNNAKFDATFCLYTALGKKEFPLVVSVKPDPQPRVAPVVGAAR
jgi:hypothetical protein